MDGDKNQEAPHDSNQRSQAPIILIQVETDSCTTQQQYPGRF